MSQEIRADDVHPICRNCGQQKPCKLFAVYYWAGALTGLARGRNWRGMCRDCAQAELEPRIRQSTHIRKGAISAATNSRSVK
jgi:hypothetical protein